VNLYALFARLDQDFDGIAADALALSAETLANDIRQALATPPGGPHDHPWRQTGALQDSIGFEVDRATACIGSTSDVARHQEYGTPAMPPRPTFVPLAIQSGPAIVRNIADVVERALEPR
jgi:hypothetical protein